MIISDCIEYRLFKDSQEPFKNIIEKASQRYSNNYLIEYYQKCQKGICSKLKPNGSGITKNDMIYLYGSRYHDSPCENQNERDIFVLMDIVKGIRNENDKNKYKRLMIELLNIMNFGCFKTIIIPEKALDNIKEFENYMKSLNISI